MPSSPAPPDMAAHIFGKASGLRRAQEAQASGFDMGFAADDPVECVAACPVPRCQEKPARRNRFVYAKRKAVSIEVGGSGNRRKIKVGRPSCRSRRAPRYVLERAGLEGSYLATFLDRPFPNDCRLTCRLMLQA